MLFVRGKAAKIVRRHRDRLPAGDCARLSSRPLAAVGPWFPPPESFAADFADLVSIVGAGGSARTNRVPASNAETSRPAAAAAAIARRLNVAAKSLRCSAAMRRRTSHVRAIASPRAGRRGCALQRDLRERPAVDGHVAKVGRGRGIAHRIARGPVGGTHAPRQRVEPQQNRHGAEGHVPGEIARYHVGQLVRDDSGNCRR